MRATTRRPAAQYDMIRVLAQSVDATKTCAVPQRYTLAEIQACMDNREVSGTVQIRCATCHESVADCPELRGKLVRVPEQWGWEWQARHAYDGE